MRPDIILRVRLRTSQEGGRHSAVSGKHYGCPLFVGSEAFDCRFLLDGRVLLLGEEYDLPVKFLNRSLVWPKLFVGQTVRLWEGKVIGDGTVVELFAE
jgi:hypothetical protein